MLEKPGGLPSRRVGPDSSGACLPVDGKGGGGRLALSPGGGEGH